MTTASDTITCTNHYRSPELARPRPPKKFRTDERLETLNGLAAGSHSFALADLTAALHTVHQGALTVQTMIFEPAALAIHVGFGPPPTTARPPVRIDLTPLWAGPMPADLAGAS